MMNVSTEDTECIRPKGCITEIGLVFHIPGFANYPITCIVLIPFLHSIPRVLVRLVVHQHALAGREPRHLRPGPSAFA